MAIKSETVEIEIDGEAHTFQVNQLPATKGQEVFLKLGNIIGGGIGGGDVVSAVGNLLSKLSAKDVEYLQKALLFDAGAIMDNAPFNKAVFDNVFAGNLFASYKLLKFALEINFQDFKSGLSVLGEVAKKALSSLGGSSIFSGPSTELSKITPGTEASTIGKPS